MTSPAVPTSADRRRAIHERMKQQRAARFSQNVFGEKQRPAHFPPMHGFIYDPPSYRRSARTVKFDRHPMAMEIDLKLDRRCFFTGVPVEERRKGDENTDIRVKPWMATRDHLVPLRRDVVGESKEIITAAHTTQVWASNVANVSLGLAPLLVRLTIRRWLMTIPFDRNDLSVENGNRVRWIIINLLDDFRVEGRFPWSRKEGISSEWWNPAISEPFMERMWQAERLFISLDDRAREKFIETLNWRF